jgi:acyl-CoA reductase-like NAD-dependent aldehyde dehydrogenase
LSLAITKDTGKPIREARLEIGFAVDLVVAAVRCASEPDSDARPDQRWRTRRCPLGVIGAITPWNNAVAIPMGKLAPALAHGNTVVWKPAPAGSRLAAWLVDVMLDVGLPSGVVTLVHGDRPTAEHLAESPGVDAVTFTGSTAAGHQLYALCARRRAPFQGELGGNNAAIIWSDAELAATARAVAGAGFGSAGQRCTATRRLIVADPVYDRFRELFLREVAALGWGDPLLEDTVVGPLISAESLARVVTIVTRARAKGATVLVPHGARLAGDGFYHPPTIVEPDDDAAEVVQEESFGPLMVLQRARDFDHALELCNGVAQGLVAAIFTSTSALQDRFVAEARAGMLKLNMPTAGASALAPFGGWKNSGIGPFEHGAADLEFYSRRQTFYF